MTMMATAREVAPTVTCDTLLEVRSPFGSSQSVLLVPARATGGSCARRAAADVGRARACWLQIARSTGSIDYCRTVKALRAGYARTVAPVVRRALQDLVSSPRSSSAPHAKRRKQTTDEAEARLRGVLEAQVCVPEVAKDGVWLLGADGRRTLLKCRLPGVLVHVWTLLNAWRPLVAEIMKIGTSAEDADDAVTRMHKCLYVDESGKFRAMVSALEAAISAVR